MSDHDPNTDGRITPWWEGLTDQKFLEKFKQVQDKRAIPLEEMSLYHKYATDLLGREPADAPLHELTIDWTNNTVIKPPWFRCDLTAEDDRELCVLVGLSPSEWDRLPETERLPFMKAAIEQRQLTKAATSCEQRGKRMTIDQRMKLLLFENPDSSGWSITKFQTELKCSRGGIHKTASWKALEAARKLGKTDRRTDRRGTKPR